MPSDFSRQFKREVFFKKRTEKCTWSRHLKPGSALREVVRALENLAKKRPDRYVFASPKALLSQINKRGGSYRKGRWAGQLLSLTSLEKALPFLQQLGILSPTLKHAPEDNQHTPGWVLAPHDDCCETYPKCCKFHGPGKKGHWVMTPHFVWIANGLAAIMFEDEQEPGAFVIPGQENPQ
jgi:hypothetical protein